MGAVVGFSVPGPSDWMPTPILFRYSPTVFRINIKILLYMSAPNSGATWLLFDTSCQSTYFRRSLPLTFPQALGGLLSVMESHLLGGRETRLVPFPCGFSPLWASLNSGLLSPRIQHGSLCSALFLATYIIHFFFFSCLALSLSKPARIDGFSSHS